MSISKKRLKEIEAIKDEDIDYSDIPEADESFWRRAELQMPQPKKGVYVRLDADVLDWLKSKGKDERHAAGADGKRPQLTMTRD
jgi:uncharacterized protein (DUF4415 family)